MSVVVKIGGARAVDPEGALADVASLVQAGEDVVVVHGGSTKVDETLERMGIEPTYVETPAGVTGRFTDAETMAVFTMAMSSINTDLVAGLRKQGVDALGLSGVDGGLLTGKRKSAVRVVEDGKKKIKRGEHSGRIDAVNTDLLETLLSSGHTPVTGPPMLGDDGTPVNTDADRAAAAVAGALDATLVLLTDVEGVYADPEDPSTLISRVETGDDWADLEAAAEGFMTKKVMAAKEALDGGSPAVVVANANADDPVSSAVGGGGTHIQRSAVQEVAEQ
ncbi:acetylglutamate/acetylaminoadipate kinase [Salinigranum halophilum]|jgi:acetylglutamate/LysW-gamma-L-alpha-aminoadipate kinase|uniref:acetylglutamate/acetylaminoadipate kinase n=1 Tax=Salinigranum halophilum TaxID=2565931 RepID=UPI00115F0AA5|nr:acetylglutamate/acetylaminoadipate kinase [Salinigranum halophilum]